MNTPEFRRIGLTGGIGSGKSTLARLLAEKGIQVIDADAISRQLTATGGAAMAALARDFGADFVAADGSMNRERMRELVFSQADARLRLQALLHPLISAEIQARQEEIRQKNISLVVIDMPLLVESSYWRRHADRVLVVDCDENTQVRRVVQRSQLKPEQVLDIMAQQAGRAAAGLPPLQGPSYEAFVAFCTRSLATGKFDAEEFTKQGLDAWTLQNAYMYLAKSEFGRKILNAVGMPVGEPPQPQQMMGMPVGEERMWPPQQQQRMLVGPPQQGIMPAQPHGMPQRPPPGHYHSRPLPPPGHYRSLPPLPPPDGEWKQLADDAYQKKEGGLFSFLWK